MSRPAGSASTPGELGFPSEGLWLDRNGRRYWGVKCGPESLMWSGGGDTMQWRVDIYDDSKSTHEYRISIEVDYLGYRYLDLGAPDRRAQFEVCFLAAARQALFHRLLTTTMTVKPSATGDNALGIGYGPGQDGILASTMASAEFWFKVRRDHQRQLQLYVREAMLRLLEPHRLSGVDRSSVLESIPVSASIVDREIDRFVESRLIEAERSESADTLVITDEGVLALGRLSKGLDLINEEYQPSMTNIVQVGTMSNSAIQQAGPQSSQVIAIDASRIQELAALVQEIEQSTALEMEDADKAELQAQLQTLSAQLASRKPIPSVVSQVGRVVADILTQAAGGLGAAYAAKLLGLLP